jgi:CYTH domain-containing protein
MADEIEVKIKISKQEHQRLINKYELIETKRIEQNYLFPETAQVKYCEEDKQWKVVIIIDGSIQYGFNLQAREEEYEEITKAINELDNKAILLANEKVACRIRESKGVYEFCYKQPKQEHLDNGEKVDYEFEYQIVLSDLTPIIQFLKQDPFKVIKNRTVLNVNEFSVCLELDEFIIQEDYLAECEFKTLAHKQSVDLSQIIVGEDLTGSVEYSNKNIARANGEAALGLI